jgi:hypothetical protein
VTLDIARAALLSAKAELVAELARIERALDALTDGGGTAAVPVDAPTLKAPSAKHVCPTCGKTFSTGQGVGGHRAKAHPVSPVPVAASERPMKAGEKHLWCASCDFVTQSAVTMNTHTLTVHHRPASKDERTPRVEP